VFPGVYGVSRPRVAPGLDLEAQLDDAADAATALLSSRGLARGLEIGGDGARLGVVFKGPFARLGIHVEAAGFQLRYGGLDLRGVGFRVSAAPWAARYALRGLSADSRAGGRVSGDVDVERTRIELGLDFDRFATGPLLPAALRVPALGALDGTVRVSFDPAAGVGSVERVALTLRRPPGAAGPRVVRLRAAAGDLARGTLRVPRVALSLAGASLTAGGSVALWDPARHDWLSPPTLDLTVAAQGLALDQLLGVGFVRGRLSFRARLRGPLDDLGVAIEVPPAQSLLILDQSFRLPRRLALRLDDRGLVMSEAVLEGPEESEIGAAGHLTMSGRFDVAVTARRFPFGRLPGLGQTALPFAGEISGELRLAGDAERPRLSGQLSFDPVTFQGRRVGGGLVTVDPVPGGGIHARGRLAQGIDAEGTLRPGRGGLEGEATMELHALRLDPFLAALPGGVRAVGVVSGAVVARVAPGHPASVDGKLTELALSVEPPAWATRARAVELHAERTIEISAESGQGAIHIGPAHFGGSFGSFEVEGEAQGGRARAALRGHVELGAFAPLTAAWLDRLTGAVDVDVTAARAAESAPLALEGGVTVTRPLAVRARALPIEIGIPSGRLRLSETGVDTTGLPVTLPGGTVHVSGGVTQPAGGGPARLALSATGNLDAQLAALLAPKLVRRAQGKVSLTALLDGTPQRPLLRAGVDLGRTALELPGVGNVTVGSAGLRLAGDPERTMMLSGDVEVAEARIPASALKEAKAKAKRPAARPARPPSAADRLRLDVRLRSRDGAVHIEVPKAPDLTLDLDMRVGGSLAQPQITGKTEGSDLYSRFVLWLTGAPH
jgi:hypothetical protein